MYSHMKRILFAVIALLCYLNTPAAGEGHTPVSQIRDSLRTSVQQDPEFITLYGQVADSATGERLYYASVNLSGTSVTNVSNSEGVFSLKIPADVSQDAMVLVSHLGFKTSSIPVANFASSTSRRPLQIELQSITLTLDPAIVHAVEPEAIFAAAFYRVRDNYPQQHIGMTAFYREMIRKGSGKYLALNEAVIDIDKAPYSGIQMDRSAIYKGRGSLNYDRSDSLIINFRGGITSALEIDLVKNPFAGVTIDQALKVYDFGLERSVIINGKSFYVVTFDQKPSVEEILFHGKVFIESESLAIGRLEFSMNTEGREEEASRVFVVKRPPQTTFFINGTEYIVNYREDGGLWYFDYCRMTLDLATRKRGTLFRNNYSITGEMAVTNHSPEPIAIDPEDRVKVRDILSQKVTDFTDDNFWEDYNIIEPDQSIDNVIRRIVRQLERR